MANPATKQTITTVLAQSECPGLSACVDKIPEQYLNAIAAMVAAGQKAGEHPETTAWHVIHDVTAIATGVTGDTTFYEAYIVG
jgi:hypothetical protein